MHKLIQNKHFVTQAAKVTTYALTFLFVLAVMALLLWRAPEQLQGAMTAAAYVLGAVFGVPKIAIK